MNPTLQKILLFKKRILVSDSFDRVDNPNSLGVSDTGQAWQVATGTYGINGNSLCKTLGTAVLTDLAYVLSGINDVQVSADLKFGANVGLLARVDSVSNNHILARISSSGLMLYDNTITPLSSTTLGSYNFTPTVGNVYKLQISVKGNSCVVYLDGVKIFDVITSILIGVYCGVRIYDTDYTSRVDNFKVEAA